MDPSIFTPEEVQSSRQHLGICQVTTEMNTKCNTFALIGREAMQLLASTETIVYHWSCQALFDPIINKTFMPYHPSAIVSANFDISPYHDNATAAAQTVCII